MPDRPSRRHPLGALRRLRRRGPDAAPAGPTPEQAGPVLTVIVPVYNVARYLRECLDSVLGQTLEDLEVIAVDDGSTDTSPEILAEYAARDPRLRIVTQANGGLGAARNRGIELVRGEFLTFCDSDDTLPPRAYELMVRTLRRSGSDFVVGAARRVKHGRNRQIAWGDTVHAFDRISTSIEEFPAALQDIIACNRVFRTDFWRGRIGVFEEGIAYEDHVPMLAAYVRADRFDVLARVTYFWRMREDLTSIGQQKADLQNLRDRVAVKQQAFDLLQAEATPAAYATWVGRCLDIDFPPFLQHALTGSAEYREVLATTYRTFLDRASEEALRTVRHTRLVRAWLCAGRHWDELAETDEWYVGRRPPVVRVEGDRMYAVPDLPAAVVELVPASAWELAESETALRAAVSGVRRDETTLRVDGYALIPGLDTSAAPADLEAWLVERTDGRRLDLTPTTVVDPEIDQWVEDSVGHAHSGFALTIDLDEVDPGTWWLRLRVRHGQVVREGGVYEAVLGSAARQPRREVVELAGAPVRVEPSWDAAGGFQLLLAPAGVVIDELTPPEGVTLRGRVRGSDLAGLRVSARIDDDQIIGTPVADDGSFSLDVLDTVHTWSLRSKRPGERGVPLLWAGPDGTVGAPGPGRLVWQPGADGVVQAVPDGRACRVERLELRGDEIVAEVSTTGISTAELHGARWRSKHLDLPIGTIEVGAESATMTFPLRVTPEHGVPMLPRTGAYALAVPTTDGLEIEAVASSALAATVPWSRLGADVRLSLRVRLDRTLVADLGAPIDDEERSPAYQEQLRRDYHRAAAAPRTPAVLLHAVGPADGRRALDAGLTLAHPEVARLWAVGDGSDPVPDGAVPVLLDSREWYDAISRSAGIWACGDLPDYVRRGDGQRILQLFEGFPVQPVGRSAWRARGFAEPAIARELARRRQQWDAIVAPTADLADLYRHEFDFDGRVLVTGHPRYDDLVTRDRAGVRAEVLARLGVPPDRTVVLHARAHRRLATQALLRDAPPADLDLVRLAEGLGPDHVVLTIGVPRVPRTSGAAARVIDATTYPAVNDLVLAADVAVLDYADLRFDWALTGRPAIFHVPDHDAYLAAVPAPLDFDTTAPGPQVHDTDSVIDTVRDRARVEAEHADAVADLNRTFNALHDGHAAERVVAALLDQS